MKVTGPFSRSGAPNQTNKIYILYRSIILNSLNPQKTTCQKFAKMLHFNNIRYEIGSGRDWSLEKIYIEQQYSSIMTSFPSKWKKSIKKYHNPILDSKSNIQKKESKAARPPDFWTNQKPQIHEGNVILKGHVTTCNISCAA